MIRIQQLKVPLNYDEAFLRKEIARKLKIQASDIKELRVRKQSLDARKKPDLYYVLTVDFCLAKEQQVLKKKQHITISQVTDSPYQMPEGGSETLPHRPVIAGFGPAGLFCALLLARAGYCPLVLERGADVDQRTTAVEQFWKNGILDTESNIQFGEGGAGTFSDGKLNTLVKDACGRNHYVLKTFVEAGADPDILYVNKPHIGTDVLRNVVKHIRQEILSLGGEVRFGCKVTDLKIKDQQLVGVCVNHTEEIPCEALVLAIGHSARDTFAMLHEHQVLMQPKSFAVGLRIEHPQSMINLSQYGQEHHPLLGAANYKVTRKLANGRGVYSFCMCPGGYVVNASSEEGRLAVNGMSYRARDSRNANSAMIVTVTPDDFGHAGVLGGIEFQRDLEKAAWQAGNGKVPVQLLGDFCENITSTGLGDVTPCIKGNWQFGNLREVLPEIISQSLIEGVHGFERQIHGFSRPDALFSGVESRTSSPVRIVRDERFLSSLTGLYPCGEGAGYAGGITSAAMDGMKVAEAVIKKYRKN